VSQKRVLTATIQITVEEIKIYVYALEAQI